MQSEQSEQPVCGVPAGPLPIFDGPNCNPPVPLPTPVHGNVRDPPVPWHLLHSIDTPMPLQENIQQTAMIQHAAIMLGMQLAEPCLFFWGQPIDPFFCQLIDPLELQEDIVQFAELICRCNI